jgi:hypothetical protein
LEPRPGIADGRFEGAVVLADVDAVGPEFASEGGVVVEDEGDAGFTAQRDQGFRDTPDGGEVVVLGAELEEVSAAGQQGGGGGDGVFLRGVAEVEDGVEAGVSGHWSAVNREESSGAQHLLR